MPAGSKPWLHWPVRACFCTAVVLFALFVAAWQWVGSPQAAWALLRGEEVAVIPARVDLGDCRAGDFEEIELRVVNLSSARVTLTGVHTACSCMVSGSLPALVAPRGETTLRMTIQASGEPGEFARRAVLYTDSATSPQLPVEVVGRICGASSREELVPIPQPAVTAEDAR